MKKVTLVKSLIGTKPNQKATAKSLGLVKIGDSIVHQDNAVLAGKIKVIRSTNTSMRASAVSSAASQYAYRNLYGALALMFVLSLALVLTLGENLMFFIPLCCVTVAMILYHLTSLKFWLPVAVVLVLLHAFSFYFALAMALTIGALGAVMMLAFLDMMVLIPLADIYLLPSRRR